MSRKAGQLIGRGPHTGLVRVSLVRESGIVSIFPRTRES